MATRLADETLADIQGFITSGYGHLPFANYLFLQIHDAAGAQAYLAQVLPRVTTAAPWPKVDGKKQKPPAAVNVAFSAAGLAALGLPQNVRCTFPLEFQDGIATRDRSAILGDTEESAPEKWEFGGSDASAIHVAVIIHGESAAELERETTFQRDLVAKMRGAVTELPVATQSGHRPPNGHEPFGFRDGIAQPSIRGVPDEGVPTGEFILGYENHYALVPPSPVVPDDIDGSALLPALENPYHQAKRLRDLGLNGSYVVYRKLRQDVAGFWQFMQREAVRATGRPDPAHMNWVAARMMGRWPGGAPLATTPDRDDPNLKDFDGFLYDDDVDGFACPLGAHVRRTNPRAVLKPYPVAQSLSMTEAHRILRRARMFGPTLFNPESGPPIDLADDGIARGIHFFCVNASIKSQFEFVQQTWCNNPRFGGLTCNPDPIVGDNGRPDAPTHMEIRRRGEAYRTAALPRFVTVKAGAYLFMPSIRALSFLSAFKTAVLSALIAVFALPVAISAQDQPAVFRTSTELVQTDVMVFDKDGRFVNDLRREDFELRIDGRVKPVRFFEQVMAGTANEASQLNAARGAAPPSRSRVASSGGRILFFYVDDLHLDAAGLSATQRVIGDFIEEDMGQDDRVAIASASGQIGFLQQLTNNKLMLRNAVQRIKPRTNTVRDFERPPMTEYQAVLLERFDRDLFAFFVQETLRNNPGILVAQAENLVRGRARMLLQQSAQITGQTLAGLEGLIRSSSKLPGRKLAFFFSGGFVLDNSDRTSDLRQVTSAAARNGTVIYSIDARGLVAGSPDANSPAADISGVLLRTSLGELNATQDGLNALARDTGGRAILNTNAVGAGLARALEETALYYLLAWEPDREMTQKAGTFRNIEIRLIDKPNLTVRMRRGFFDVEPPPRITSKKKESEPLEAEEPDPTTLIFLSLNYVFTADRGMKLTTSVQVPTAFLSFSTDDGKQRSKVHVAGRVFNDRGDSGEIFNKVVNVDREPADSRNEPYESFSHEIFLGPGLYQVQVGVRDEASGRLATAQSWIEIPDLSSRQLALSTLNIGQTRFRRDAVMRFFLFAYNAARADSKPDLAIQVELLQNNRIIVKTPPRRMATEDQDLNRIPYAADLSLADLPAGSYLLRATVIDRVSGKSASQETHFEIE